MSNRGVSSTLFGLLRLRGIGFLEDGDAPTRSEWVGMRSLKAQEAAAVLGKDRADSGAANRVAMRHDVNA